MRNFSTSCSNHLVSGLLTEVGQWFRMPMSWVLLIAVDICLVTFSSAQDQAENPNTAQAVVQVVEIEAPLDATAGIRFEAVDVFIDSGDRALAAWQLELQSTVNSIEIVGIEGGQHAAFSEPAYYDPKAMNGNRVVLAAFSTAKDLPRGKTRVARIHVQCEGRNVMEYRTSLIVAADSAGKEIQAQMTLTKARLDDASGPEVR
ncbi:MAG: hypothetical protein ABJZ55_24470 [Fuerstiella sp.]